MLQVRHVHCKKEGPPILNEIREDFLQEAIPELNFRAPVKDSRGWAERCLIWLAVKGEGRWLKESKKTRMQGWQMTFLSFLVSHGIQLYPCEKNQDQIPVPPLTSCRNLESLSLGRYWINDCTVFSSAKWKYNGNTTACLLQLLIAN